MTENLFCIDDDRTIGAYDYDGKRVELLKSDVRALWNYEDDGTFIKLHCNDKQVYGVITVASGQGGAAVVWDAATGKIIHLSDGAYAVDAAVTDNYVYTLLEISNFVTPSTIKLMRSRFGVLDKSEGEEVVTDIPEDLLRFKAIPPEDIQLSVNEEDNTLCITGITKAEQEPAVEYRMEGARSHMLYF